MPLDPIIARGVAPIDVSNSLYQLAALQRGDREIERRERTNDLLERRYDAQQKAAGDLQEQKQALAKVEWALASPSPARAILDDPEAVEAFRQAGMDLAGLDDEKARQLLMRARGSMSSALGIGPPAGQSPKRDIRTVGGALVEVPAEGDPRELYRAPSQAPQYAPTERERDWKLRQSLTPEQRAEYDRLYGKSPSEARPQIIPDPFGGDPSVIEQGPGGGYVRRAVPMVEQGAGPTDVRAQAFDEARRAIATGRITKEQAAERLRKAGIDPTGL